MLPLWVTHPSRKLKINYSNPTNTVLVALGAYNRILEKTYQIMRVHTLAGKWITLNETWMKHCEIEILFHLEPDVNNPNSRLTHFDSFNPQLRLNIKPPEENWGTSFSNFTKIALIRIALFQKYFLKNNCARRLRFNRVRRLNQSVHYNV